MAHVRGDLESDVLMPVGLSVEQQGLNSLARELKQAEDGKRLRRDLSKAMRGALDPAVEQIKAGVMAVPSGSSTPTSGPGLRSSVAKQIKAQATLTGRRTGAKIAAKRTPGVRNFRHAPKRLNARKGWRRPVFGSNTWVTQMGNPGYFDDPITDRRGEFRTAVLDVMEDFAATVAKKGA